MNEVDAKEFVKAEVRHNLLKIAAGIGLANLVTLLGMYVYLERAGSEFYQTQLESETTKQKEIFAKEIEEMRDLADQQFKLVEQSISEVSSDLTTSAVSAHRSVGAATERLSLAEDQLATLIEKIDGMSDEPELANSKITALQLEIDSSLERLEGALSDDGSNLLERLASLAADGTLETTLSSGEVLNSLRDNDEKLTQLVSGLSISLTQCHYPATGLSAVYQGNGYHTMTEVWNPMDEPSERSCPTNFVMHGVWSGHHNGTEDRSYKYQCCRLTLQ